MSDPEYVRNYRPNRLYINPGSEGAYASIAMDYEELLGEVEVTDRSRIAISAFYLDQAEDFRTYKITKLRFHARQGWLEDGFIQINKAGLAHILQINEILSLLDLHGAAKDRVDLRALNPAALEAMLEAENSAELLTALSESKNLAHDIFAVAEKRKSLQIFSEMLEASHSEREWQLFFEQNAWIFGFGLTYVFLDRVGEKFESVVSGHEYDKRGKRVDALAAARAEVSKYVLIEIKRPDTHLLRSTEYRADCWAVSDEVAGAVSQIQKTSFEFSRRRFRDQPRDQGGYDSGAPIYSVSPRSFLVVGSLSQIAGNDAKISSFELFRSNLSAPEIITFDELFERSKQILENLERPLSARIVHEDPES